MIVNIETLISEFEMLTMDEKLFFKFINSEDVEVNVWYKKYDKRPWYIWYPMNEKASKQNISGKFLPQVLDSFKVSHRLLNSELANVLLLQAAYADEFINLVSQLFGASAIQHSINQMQNFMKDFKKLVDNLNNSSSTNVELKTVANNHANTPKLRVLKNIT